MRTISNVDAHMRISALKATVPELVKKRKLTNPEDGMYVAFKMAQIAIDECSKANYYWRDAKIVAPKHNGLFLVVVNTTRGKKVRTAWFVDGKWVGDFEVTHWGLMPPLPEEV